MEQKKYFTSILPASCCRNDTLLSLHVKQATGLSDAQYNSILSVYMHWYARFLSVQLHVTTNRLHNSW